ncbi:hypothetical protein I5H56_gp055 [Mycobacterium phage KristaRAM]|uniref:Uncharacterized protein n=2 Tax=Cheoctovirus TaxID=1623281 RepID=A0A385DZQ9_9CAUD|nr:hypothetical protein PBI_OVECHKIN_49 [Mycobacterium phage Ovechkin]YP_009959008.1 hypothetical protein I5H56_gp055 [Mycobacterium phage KristaRAM]QHB47402.1 hypothetical protein SEA_HEGEDECHWINU_52 [Mycobacterium phage Hegedechwinu]UVK63086.1 membrane protein [Mycobacterium phage Beakin]AKQ06951.1 hypothetical protein PBI_OVECHKIN_49 [Mycobacterium phage Ovechkin]AXQ64112.1 hypothetical protein SEA_KRISTARAM_55 [Mycobacterium phage KristaRAM]
MSGLLWILVAVVVAAQVPQVLLALAPRSLWDRLYDSRPTMACFLWGYSHPFGPSWSKW